MIEGKRVLALIPARGGSKGIKDKNITPLCGKPLIAYSVLAAKNSRYIDDVVVTTDSERIAETAKAYGAEVPFLRPAELASDTAKTIDAVLHAVKWLEDHQKSYDLLVLLQPTQPLRRTEDIDGAIELCIQRDMQDVVSVKEVSEHPILMRTIDEKGELQNVLSMQSTVRRQDMPQYYLVDGSVYVNRIETLSESTSFNDNPIPYIMDAKYSVDIDEPSDLEQAETAVKEIYIRKWKRYSFG